jgi:signal transduction histidine kinase
MGQKRASIKRWLKVFLKSPVLSRVATLPPIVWLITLLTRRIVRRTLEQTTPIRRTAEIERLVARDLNSALKMIVVDMVHSLGYVGAMVATYEQGDCLMVRAYYLDPQIAPETHLQLWEKQISQLSGSEMSLSNPKVARVYRYQKNHQNNLSIRAIETCKATISDQLFDLFVPIVPPMAHPVVNAIQEELGIRQVLAVPFFIADQSEPVGNLFVAKRSPITDVDIHILGAVSHQAALALESERRRLEIEITQGLVLKMQANLRDETAILKHVVQGVVESLGFVGALVSTYESDKSLPIRASYIDPEIATIEQVLKWEQELSAIVEQPVSITNADIGRVYLRDDDAMNLSVKAARTGENTFTDDLFELFAHVVPNTTPARKMIRAVQESLQIQQIIAIPFFIQNEDGTKDFVGNLFAATRSRSFTGGEVRLLTAFAQQAAVGITNARLFRLSEERREIAQLFGKMAFSAAAYVHELKNHVTVAKGAIQLVQTIDTFPPQLQEEIRSNIPIILQRLNVVTGIIEKLHEPWHQSPDSPVDIKMCIDRAIEKITRDKMLKFEMDVQCQEGLPPVFTSHDMLTEALRILLKNAVEAVNEAQREEGVVSIKSNYQPASREIHVIITDNGLGIRPENLRRVFELRWSSKQYGRGFGLFWAKEYIDNLKGRIEVKSEVGIGSEFHVILPVHLT